MTTVAERPYTVKLRIYQQKFELLNRADKRRVVLKLVDVERRYKLWDARGRSYDWARVRNALEDYITGSEIRFSVHE